MLPEPADDNDGTKGVSQQAPTPEITETSSETHLNLQSPDKDIADVVGENMFSALFPVKKEILPPALVITSSKAFDSKYEFSMVGLADTLQVHRPREADRIMKAARHGDSRAVKYPVGGIMNVALADPHQLTFEKNNLCSKTNGSWVMSTLLGQTTYFSNSSENVRQICIKPFTHGWHRFTAVLAGVLGHATFHVSSFKGGVSFVTNLFDKAEAKRPIVKKGNDAPIPGPSLSSGDKIPIYDGRKGFRVGKYWAEEYNGDVENGSTVMLLFSIRKVAVYFNILGIVVLTEEENAYASTPSQAPPTAFGVKEIITWPAKDGEAALDQGDTTEDEEELVVNDEPVL